MAALTHEVLHHGGVVMRRGSQAQQLLTAGHGGVVDGLHVDVVSLQQTVTHLCVQLGVAHLRQEKGECGRKECLAAFVVVFTGCG